MPKPVNINPPSPEREELRNAASSALSDLDTFASGTTTLTTAQLTAALRKMAAVVARIIRYIARKEGWL